MVSRGGLRMAQLSVIGWYGGKSSISKQIINLMPRHDVYVEVFGGSGVILLNKMRSSVEIYNDINKGLASLFSVLADKDKAEELWEKLQLTPYSRWEFDCAKKGWDWGFEVLGLKKEDVSRKFQEGSIGDKEYREYMEEIRKEYDDYMIEAARMFYVLCRQSYSYNLKSWIASTVSDVRGSGASLCCDIWVNAIQRGFYDVVERLRNVRVENLSYGDVLEKYDGPGVLFYLDPPYVMGARKDSKSPVYDYEMDDELHQDLVNRLLGLKGRFIISGYDNKIYEPLEDGSRFYKMRVGEKAVSSKNNGRCQKRDRAVEYVWTNFKPGEA